MEPSAAALSPDDSMFQTGLLCKCAAAADDKWFLLFQAAAALASRRPSQGSVISRPAVVREPIVWAGRGCGLC